MSLGPGPNVALVTGAASGIGRALAKALATRAEHIWVADIDLAGAEQAAAEISASGTNCRAAALDVTDAAAFSALAGEIVTEHGRLDLLVNNAGTAVGGEVQDLTLEHWNRVLDVNLKGVVHGVRAAYPGMLERGRGHIVNIASVAGLAPAPMLAPYAASKFGVVGLSLSLRAEAAARGVGVTVVCPAAIETPLLERTAPDGMATPASAPNTRQWVTQQLGPPYSPDALARDVLRAIDRDRAMLVAPARARLAAGAMRVFPGLALRIAERSVRKERERS